MVILILMMTALVRVKFSLGGGKVQKNLKRVDDLRVA